MGALETKKQLVFSGGSLGRCSGAVYEGESNAAKLECSMSKGESPRVSGSYEQTGEFRLKSSPSTWLGRVNDDWDHILYKAGRGWKLSPVDALLTSEVDLERLARERNWLSFASVSEAGGM